MSVHPLVASSKFLGKTVLGLIGLAPKQMVTSQSSDADLAAHFLEHYGFGGFGTDTDLNNANALSYPPLFRCNRIISGILGWLISEGHVSIVNLDGDIVDNRRTRKVLDLLMGVPDGRTSSETFWGDAGSDYGIWGNSMTVIRRDSMFQPVSLQRMDTPSVTIDQGTRSNRSYSGSLASDFYSRYDTWDEQDVVHARWPHLRPQEGTRQGMAESPVRLLGRVIRSGIAAQIYNLRDLQNSGVLKGKATFLFKEPLSKEQQDAVLQAAEQFVRSNIPGRMANNPAIHMLNSQSADADTRDIRGFLVDTTGAIYGIPSVLLNSNLALGVSNIQELGRLAWGYGLKFHVGAMLSGLRVRLLGPREKFLVNTMPLQQGNPKDMANLIRAVQGDAQRPPLATLLEIRKMIGLPATPDKELIKQYRNFRPQSAISVNQEPPVTSTEGGAPQVS